MLVSREGILKLKKKLWSAIPIMSLFLFLDNFSHSFTQIKLFGLAHKHVYSKQSHAHCRVNQLISFTQLIRVNKQTAFSDWWCLQGQGSKVRNRRYGKRSSLDWRLGNINVSTASDQTHINPPFLCSLQASWVVMCASLHVEVQSKCTCSANKHQLKSIWCLIELFQDKLLGTLKPVFREKKRKPTWHSV